MSSKVPPFYSVLVLDEVKCKTHTQQQNSVHENHLRLVNLTENYAKHTFQAPYCCFESVLTKTLLLLETINVSIDCVLIKYLISKRKLYSIERQHKVLFVLFCLIISSRESDYICIYFSMKCLMRTLDFVPKCTGCLHGMGLN